MRVDMDCGISVTVISMSQRLTYAGMLCGKPSPELNAALEKAVFEGTRQRLSLSESVPVLFLPPEKTPTKAFDMDIPLLPVYATWFLLEEPAEARLAVATFCDALGLSPVDMKRISQIEWRSVAAGWCF